LERYKKYPRGFGGRHSDLTVLVHVELDRQGKLLSLGIVKSSGSETYDNAAMATFRRAEPMPPFPASMTRPMLSLNVPVRFKQEE
jgi:protein TonB